MILCRRSIMISRYSVPKPPLWRRGGSPSKGGQGHHRSYSLTLKNNVPTALMGEVTNKRAWINGRRSSSLPSLAALLASLDRRAMMMQWPPPRSQRTAVMAQRGTTPSSGMAAGRLVDE